jgi:peptidoglycan/LPS O-acetylase OafA/YrhL
MTLCLADQATRARMSKESKYRSNLGVLRFLLALWVFLAHTVPWYAVVNQHKLPVIGKVMALLRKLQSNGELHPAVVGFLVLSGYVISSSFPMARQVPALKIKAWAIRRFFRIYPIYLLGIVFGLIFWTLSKSNPLNINLSSTDHLNAGCIAAKTTLISAFTPFGYPNCALQGNSPLITAAAEMLLYAIYGLIIIWLTKRRFAFMFQCIFILWFGLTILTGYLGSTHPNYVAFWIHGSPLNYLLPWWLGVLLIQKFTNHNFLNFLKLALPAFILGAIWVLTRHHFNTNASQKFVMVELNLLFLSLAFACLIYLLELAPQLPKAIAKVENLGYALYALHAPLSLYLLFSHYSYLEIVLINLVVVIAAYAIIEKPLREFGRKLSKI